MSDTPIVLTVRIDGLAEALDAVRADLRELRHLVERLAWNAQAAADKEYQPGAADTSEKSAANPVDAPGGVAPEPWQDGTADDPAACPGASPADEVGPETAQHAVVPPCLPASAEIPIDPNLGGQVPVDARRRAGPRPTDWLTQARAAILDAGWPRGEPVSVLRARLAAEDGPPLPDNTRIGIRASSRGLRRPAGFTGQRVAPAPAPVARAMVLPSAAPKPPARPGVAAAPASLASRDGYFSQAAMLLREQQAETVSVKITLAEAAQWGARNGVTFGKGDSGGEMLRAINDKRREFQLPPYQLVKPRVPFEPLPHPETIAHAGETR